LTVRIPEATRIEYQRDALRAVDLSLPEGDVEYPTEKDHFDAVDPNLETIHRALGEATAKFESEKARLLLAHLQCAAGLATSIGAGELARVLSALESATFYDKLSILNDRDYKSTMLGAANKLLEGESGHPGAKRPELIRQIARRFRPEPKDAEGRAKGLVLWMESFGLEFERELGPAKPEWWVSVVDECVRVQRRPNAWQRWPEAYTRAVLRGWGLTEARANEAAKPLRDE
jgi:hypothetical protein